MADAGRGDWLLCQITSQGFGDQNAVELREGDFADGALRRESYARPAKLFCADAELIVRTVGRLMPASHQRIVDAVIRVLRAG